MMVTFSFLILFVFLIVFLENVVHASFSFRPSNSTCVWTERQLRKVIERASNVTRTKITLCRQVIAISSTLNQYYSTGIDVTDRSIDLKCYLKRSKGSCTLDAGGSSRIFSGERADLTMRNILFTNALPDDCNYGGAIYVYNSILTLTACSFIKNAVKCGSNSLGYGGAIFVDLSTLTIKGGSKNRPVMFSDNEGKFGGALYARISEISTDGYTVFSNNSGEFGGALSLDESTLNIKNVKFQKNVGNITSVLSSSYSNLIMKNVEFIGNVGEGPVTYFFNSSLLATSCTFAKNNGTVIEAGTSKITLKNSTFSNNMSNEDGSNIKIFDDDDPLEGGTFVKCESNVVFCNGLNKTSIIEQSSDDTIGNFSNTNCNSEGEQGIPGQGSCPI